MEIQARGNGMNEVTERILVETIERLETRVKQLESALRASESVSLDAALGPLRLRQAILLFIGNGPADGFLEEVDQKMGAEIARALSNHLFVLDNAPLSPVHRDAVRAVFQGGMNRF